MPDGTTGTPSFLSQTEIFTVAHGRDIGRSTLLPLDLIPSQLESLLWLFIRQNRQQSEVLCLRILPNPYGEFPLSEPITLA